MLHANQKSESECAMRVLVRHYVEYMFQREQYEIEEKERERKINESVDALFL